VVTAVLPRLLTTGCFRYNNYTVPFEFDPRKSEANAGRHGVDFVEAQALWADSDLLEIPARTTGEPRYLVIGRIGERHWSAVITYRDQRVRIISVRRSRQEEVSFYEEHKGQVNRS